MNYLAIVSFFKRFGVAGIGMAVTFVAVVYFTTHFNCILDTPRQGFEWECANEGTIEVLKGYLEKLNVNS